GRSAVPTCRRALFPCRPSECLSDGEVEGPDSLRVTCVAGLALAADRSAREAEEAALSAWRVDGRSRLGDRKRRADVQPPGEVESQRTDRRAVAQPHPDRVLHVPREVAEPLLLHALDHVLRGDEAGVEE